MSNTFSVKIDGLARLTKALEKAPEEIKPVMQEAINKSAAILAENTDQKTVPFKRGDLIRSFKPVVIGNLFARWFPRVDYARAIQFGMPPSRTIRASNQKATEERTGFKDWNVAGI